jgi:isopenicillin-N epimerase
MSTAAAGLRSPLASHWELDPDVTFLNHGSFGACPTAVRNRRRRLLDSLEHQPVDFMLRRLPAMYFQAVERIEDFLGAEAGSLALLANATSGVATALAAVDVRPGERIVTTGQEYFATRNAVYRKAAECGAEVVEAPVPFPADSADQLVAPIAERVDGRTALLVVDHIFSPSGMVLPLERLLDALGPDRPPVLVDGAHGPGQVELNLSDLGVDFYTGNCHKWLCSPKSCAALYVRPDRQERVRPLAQSYTPKDIDAPLSRFQLEHFWNGTYDPTPRLAVPHAIDCMAGLVEGGWREVMARNHRKVLQGRGVLCRGLGVEPPCPAELVGSMAAVVLPWSRPPRPRRPDWVDPLQAALRREGIEVPVTWSRSPRRRMLRISAQLYNGLREYRLLADALRSVPDVN